ncbi:hypothetical protein K440DRAFT_620545 [Wilcoxina mikolae CBS 423.85]|nr:hypothetical protein K440DRAFT_620545 [Wilcoxina mikolae CBS 423.85]
MRVARPNDASNVSDTAFIDEAGYVAALWKKLMVESRIYWARYFSFPTADEVNNLLITCLGPEIMDEVNSTAYDLGFGKVRAWGRQWQFQVVKRFTSHVSGQEEQIWSTRAAGTNYIKVRAIYDDDVNTMQLDNLTEEGIRGFFYRKFNTSAILQCFHGLSPARKSTTRLGCKMSPEVSRTHLARRDW